MKKTAAIVTVAMLTGCAAPGYQSQGSGSQYRPMIDLNRANAADYESDLRACQQYADTQVGAGTAAIGGAAAGALVGFLLGRALGDASDGAFLAKLGAVTTGAQAAGGAEQNQRQIIRNCLAGRGHSVLN